MSDANERADMAVRVVGDNAEADRAVFVVNQQVVAGSPSPGDVPVVQGDGSLAWGAGGGGGAGSPVVRKFPFAFDTPGLLTGAALYTPTVGDLLVDGWVEIDTAWDGTSPLGDFGNFAGTNYGWLANVNAPFDMTLADSDTVQWNVAARPSCWWSRHQSMTAGRRACSGLGSDS